MFTTPDNERLGIEDVRKVAQNEVPLVGKVFDWSSLYLQCIYLYDSFF